jgi:hypothetical protein
MEVRILKESFGLCSISKIIPSAKQPIFTRCSEILLQNNAEFVVEVLPRR